MPFLFRIGVVPTTRLIRLPDKKKEMSSSNSMKHIVNRQPKLESI
jgi:hypothetical protein